MSNFCFTKATFCESHLLGFLLFAGFALPSSLTIAGNSQANSKQTRETASEPTTTTLPSIDRDLSTSRFVISRFDLNRDGQLDAYVSIKDKDEDGKLDIRRNVQVPLQGIADRGDKAAKAEVDPAEKGVQLEASGVIKATRAVSTPWGEHTQLLLQTDAGELIVDCGSASETGELLIPGEKVTVLGLTGVGVHHEGLLAKTLLKDGEELQLTRAIRTHRGIIKDMLVGPVGQTRHLMVILQNQERTQMYVHLGPLTQLPKTLHIGDQLMVSGSAGQLDDRHYLVADKFSVEAE